MRDAAQENAVIYARQSSGKAKSIADQIAECREDAEGEGFTVAGVEQDGVSASRFAGRSRDAWARVLTGIAAGDLDVLVLWECSRGDRDAEQWLGLLRLCRQQSIRIRVTNDQRTYRLTSAADWRQLASAGIDSHYESEKLSDRTRRGVKKAAEAGRPAMGPCPYGYVRRYSPTTGELIGQEPDPKTAPIVVEIIEKVAQSVPLTAICADLNSRGVPAPGGGTWRRLRVRYITMNVAYLALRRHGEKAYPTDQWPPLVDEATFYAAARVLNDPARLALARPGRQKYLLTYLATCSECGGGLQVQSVYYCCKAGHVGVRREATDAFVVEAVLTALANPELYRSLRQAGAAADKEAIAAQGEAAKLRADLDGWRLSAARGKTSEDSLAIIEADLTTQITAAQRRADRAGIPPALRQILEPGADVRERWKAVALPAKREIIRSLAEIRVTPARQNSHVPISERLASSRWIGDERTWGEIAAAVC